MEQEAILFKEERRSKILEVLEKEQRVEVAALAERFGVSEDTVRRDLRDLGVQGLIRKTHGGALRRIASAPPYEARLVEVSDFKMAIGQHAASLVEEGDSIIIDSGTTTLCLARSLSVSGLRILTNSLEIARVFVERPEYELILLGGRYDAVHRELVGPATVDQITQYRVDKLFMGMTALDHQHGITDVSETDATVKRAMMRVSQQVVGLADHTKIGRVSFSWVAPASEIDILVTDEMADCAALDSVGWRLIQVPLRRSVGETL